MEGAVTGLYTKMTELWDRKIEIDGKLSTLRDEIEKQKLSEALAAEIIKQESQVFKMKLKFLRISKIFAFEEKWSEFTVSIFNSSGENIARIKIFW